MRLGLGSVLAGCGIGLGGPARLPGRHALLLGAG